ncbi:proprotein convertase P-domain-containing protein [Chondromyces crocatus]|uniref:P/Homo B domain-containing protein n=1 Tax=Chondromyces crocatus TaxID=52 RepID=A0A0K1EBI1_CHOCO|nr:proprotein convertase P-domain-containing protein [Chondromyces crocatus]AKT38220.1 uncharacterized protein CMC5_023630 [Chondromyces crocatus]
MKQLLGLMVFGSLVAACAPVAEVEEGPLAQEEVLEAQEGLQGPCGGQVPVEGSKDALGMLAFLNSAAATQAVLDHEVALDARAAAGLVSRRNGPDGVLGTGDDRPFASVAEVDAVAYVNGPALAKLADYARATGWVELEDSECLGTFDTVAFTAGEGRRALSLVNQVRASALPGIGLDHRAVNSILANRLVPHMPALEALPYIGPQMMLNIRSSLYLVVPGDLCTSNADCGSLMQCVGIPYDGSSNQGRCRDLAPLPGEGESCDTTACAPGLFCTTYHSCLPGWMADEVSNFTDVTIPASTSAPVASSVIVQGQATVPVSLEVKIRLVHPQPHALRIRLVDPNGTEALLWNGPASPGQTLGSTLPVTNGISYDDSVNGRWQLLIDNAGGTQAGLLEGWTLKVTSRWD